MNPLNILQDNIESLMNEHNHHLREPICPDGPDMVDLSAALSTSIVVLVQHERDDYTFILEVVTAYLRTAYGVGYNRGAVKEK